MADIGRLAINGDLDREGSARLGAEPDRTAPCADRHPPAQILRQPGVGKNPGQPRLIHAISDSSHRPGQPPDTPQLVIGSVLKEEPAVDACEVEEFLGQRPCGIRMKITIEQVVADPSAERVLEVLAAREMRRLDSLADEPMEVPGECDEVIGIG